MSFAAPYELRRPLWTTPHLYIFHTACFSRMGSPASTERRRRKRRRTERRWTEREKKRRRRRPTSAASCRPPQTLWMVRGVFWRQSFVANASHDFAALYLRDKFFVLYAEYEKHVTYLIICRVPNFGSFLMFFFLALQVRNPRSRKGCQTMRSWPARRIDSDPSWSNSHFPGTPRNDSILRSWHYFAGYRRYSF